MALQWTPFAIPGLVALAAGWTLAGVVYLAAPRRPQNRWLALTVATTGSAAFFVSGARAMATTPGEAVAAFRVWAFAVPVVYAAYLLLLGTLPAPLSRPFRAPAAPRVLLTVAVAASALSLATAERIFTDAAPAPGLGLWSVSFGPLFVLPYVGGAAVSLFSLAVAIQARRRARSPLLRRQMSVFVVAFAVRDLYLVVAGAAGGVAGDAPAATATLVLLSTLALPLVEAFSAVVLAYGILRLQLFDIDLRLRLGAARGAVAAVAVGALFLASKAGEAVLGPTLGWGATVAALVVLAAATPMMLRVGTRLAAAATPHDEATPQDVRRRKLEVYRAHVEAALTEAGDPDGEELRRARERLGLDARDHELVLWLAERERRAPAPDRRAGRVEVGAVVGERYRVERLLGEGAHGRAFLARDVRDGREVVVKAVGPATSRALREARMAVALDHPNVVRVLDVVLLDQDAALVMEHVPGGSLRGLLRRRGRLARDEATRLLLDVLAALEAAHARGIVHRDVKPENILLAADGAAKLADFGVARDVDDATAGTLAGAGSLLYMSPEQVRGRPADARSDLYSAAVVFHEALAGAFYLPVAGRDDFEVRDLILHGSPRLHVDGEPRWVERLLTRAVAKDPAERFGSAAEMRDALAAAARA